MVNTRCWEGSKCAATLDALKYRCVLTRIAKIFISALAISLAVLHQIFPKIMVDATTLGIMCVAIAPWLVRYIKGFEIPGVAKIDLADTKAATDKVTQGVSRRADNEAPTPGVNRVNRSGATNTEGQNDPFSNLRAVYETDPNLALVGFRIEVEKRILNLARANGLDTDRVPLQQLIRELSVNGIIPAESGSGLIELVALGNRAAHGVEVSPDAASWLLDIGPSILMQLDSVRSRR